MSLASKTAKHTREIVYIILRIISSGCWQCALTPIASDHKGDTVTSKLLPHCAKTHVRGDGHRVIDNVVIVHSLATAFIQ